MIMEIVVLDGYALNPGDLSWADFEKLVNLIVYERTKSGQIAERAREAQMLLTNKTPLSGETLRQLPRLKYIGVLATGYNIVDVEAAKAQGITVTNVPTYGTSSVAQLTFALMLELCHRVELHSTAVQGGAWSRSPDWSFWLTPQTELFDKTIGIVGFGRIGKQVARIAAAFGMRIAVLDRGSRPTLDLPPVEYLGLDELLASADVVSLHCPLTAETQGMISARELALMKPGAIFINTSRGQLIVERDLADALNAGRIAGAAVDVLSAEPPPPTNPLLSAKNCIITPHLAWATREARARLMRVAAQNLAAFLEGKPINVVC
jgi:glycerate dehydrogenase